MNIHTDLVQSECYHERISPEIANCSQEYRALATLRYFIPVKYDTMIKAEAPDLQDCNNCIGIEVTAAVSEKDMKAADAFSKLCKENDSVVVQKLKQKIIESNYSIDTVEINQSTIISTSTSGTDNSEKTVFQKSIWKKIKKLHKYREKFKTMGLAVLLPEPPTVEAENHFVDWFREASCEYNDTYDFIYVISHRFCIYYNSKTDEFKKWKISSDEDCSIQKIARMTAEGKLSLESPEWQNEGV